MTDAQRMEGSGRRKEDAPDVVQQAGEVALSLWFMGAPAVDCMAVARMDMERQMLRDELEDAGRGEPDVERLRRIEAAATELVESFTAPDGSFARDALTEREWRSLGEALRVPTDTEGGSRS
jgi:hypothetical protein